MKESALQTVIDRLARLAQESPAPVYRVPGLWSDPAGRDAAARAVEPASYYLAALQGIAAAEACPPVRDIVLTASTDTSMTIGWTEQGIATQWLVSLTSQDSTYSQSFIATSKPFTVGGLTAYTNYNVGVRALNNGDTTFIRRYRRTMFSMRSMPPSHQRIIPRTSTYLYG